MRLKDYFHVSDVDGGLYDTRQANWRKTPPLRAEYIGYFGKKSQNMRVSEVKAALRAGCYTDLGGYPLYFITKDGYALSFEGAKQAFADIVSGFTVIIGVNINYEDADVLCCVTNKQIPAAHARETTSGEG